MGRNRIRPRQKIFMSTRMKIIIGASVGFASVFLMIIYFNFYDVQDSKAFSTGDYRAVSSGNWDDVTLWEVFDGEKWNPAAQPPGDGARKIIITSGQEMTIIDEIVLNQVVIEEGSLLSIEANTLRISKFNNAGALICDGTLELGSSILEGNGDIRFGSSAIIRIGSDAGIDKKGTTGNIQLTGKKEYNGDATYVFNGTVAQHTGNGLPAVIKKLVVENSSGIILDQNIQVLEKLSLKKGTIFTSKYAITLGASDIQTCILEPGTGSFSGNVNSWFGPTNFHQLEFPVSDGNRNYNLTFLTDEPVYQKGLVSIVYKEGTPDDAHRSPFEVRQVVAAITPRGYFGVMFSNGPEESWLELSNITSDTEGMSGVVWQIGKKSAGTETTTPVNKSPVPARVKSISNILYGPAPFDKQLVVRFYSEATSESNIQMTGPSGQIIHSEKIKIEQGYNQFVFNSDKLTAGACMIQISNPSEIHTFKVNCKPTQGI